jgi:outer membrane biosynthesis protein TonB
MSDSRAATGFDRLPWLADEPKSKAPPPKRGGRDLIGWAAAAVLLVAGASFWVGTRSEAPETGGIEQPKRARPSTTVPLPQPHVAQEVSIAPQPQVVPVPAPEVRPAPAPQVHAAPQHTERMTRGEPAEARRVAAEREAASKTTEEPTTSEAPPTPAPAAAAPAPIARAPLRPWQPRVVAGAAGRLVQIGAFGSVPQAKRGWWYMVRTYPAVAHLPAVVRPDRNSKGRIFYRFRVGTTSQAHSEVLCQRMEKIHLSCAVVGLPWKAKVER